MIIRSQQDWWTSCNYNWPHILTIFTKVGAPMGREEPDHWWPDKSGQPDVQHDVPLCQHLEDLRTTHKGAELSSLLGKAWMAADKEHSRQWDGWKALSALCRTQWVFYPKGGGIAEPAILDSVAERHPSEGEAPDDAIFRKGV